MHALADSSRACKQRTADHGMSLHKRCCVCCHMRLQLLVLRQPYTEREPLGRQLQGHSAVPSVKDERQDTNEPAQPRPASALCEQGLHRRVCECSLEFPCAHACEPPPPSHQHLLCSARYVKHPYVCVQKRRCGSDSAAPMQDPRGLRYAPTGTRRWATCAYGLRAPCKALAR